MAGERKKIKEQKKKRNENRKRGIQAIAEDPKFRTKAVFDRDVKRFLKRTGK